MRALIKKEILIQFASPIYPIIAALFLFLTGLAFSASLTQTSPGQLPEASLRGMIYFMALMLLFFSPLFTMRSFAEEKKTGTIELLKTSPISNLEIVIAKYLGIFLPMATLLILTIEFPLFILLHGDPDKGPMILAYLGLLLLGSVFTAIGIFFSSLTRNQALSAVLSFVGTITLWFLGDVGGKIGKKVSIIEPIHSFSMGVLDVTDLGYYLLMTLLFLFLTYRVLEAERWRT